MPDPINFDDLFFDDRGNINLKEPTNTDNNFANSNSNNVTQLPNNGNNAVNTNNASNEMNLVLQRMQQLEQQSAQLMGFIQAQSQQTRQPIQNQDEDGQLHEWITQPGAEEKLTKKILQAFSPLFQAVNPIIERHNKETEHSQIVAQLASQYPNMYNVFQNNPELARELFNSKNQIEMAYKALQHIEKTKPTNNTVVNKDNLAYLRDKQNAMDNPSGISNNTTSGRPKTWEDAVRMVVNKAKVG